MGGLCLNGNIHASGVLAHAENKMKLFSSRHKWFDIGGSGSREKAKDIDGEGEAAKKNMGRRSGDRLEQGICCAATTSGIAGQR